MKLTPEHEQISDTVRKFVAKEINPNVAEWEAAQQFPIHEVFKKLGNLGLLGLKYPAEYGGMELDFSYSADWCCLLANTSDGAPHNNKSLIVVPMDTPGITRQKIRKIGIDRSIDRTIEYTRQRQAFGKSVLDNQGVHCRLAELRSMAAVPTK